MTHTDIIQDLKKGVFHPVYYLEGEETYFIDQIIDYAEHHLLSEVERAFNLTVIYGKDAQLSQLLDALTRYPMMSEKQVVILKEAQDFNAIDGLDTYLKNPAPTTLFFIAHKYKTLDKRKSVGKTLKQKAVFYATPTVYEKDIPGHIRSMVAQYHLHLEEKAAYLLTGYVGTDLSRLDNEIQKLKIHLPPGGEITVDLIEKFIGISREFNPFELVKAIMRKDAALAVRICKYFQDNSKQFPMVAVIPLMSPSFIKGQLFIAMGSAAEEYFKKTLYVNYFQLEDLKAYRKNYSLRQAGQHILTLQQYDLKSKGLGYVGADRSAPLVEMCYEMLYA